MEISIEELNHKYRHQHKVTQYAQQAKYISLLGGDNKNAIGFNNMDMEEFNLVEAGVIIGWNKFEAIISKSRESVVLELQSAEQKAKDDFAQYTIVKKAELNFPNPISNGNNTAAPGHYETLKTE